MDVNHDALADAENKLAPTLTLPKFVTRGWVEANVGNVQASDIRQISEKCQKIIAEWPAKKLDHEEFLDQVHRCLRLPNGISILNGALHPRAARKRSLFGPVVERAVAFLQSSDKADDWIEIRKKPPTKIAEDVANILRDQNQLQLLQEIIFVDVERGLLSPDGIPWVHDSPELEDISQFVKAVGNSETISEAEDNDSAATGGAHYTSDGEEQNVSQLTVEQVAGAWTKELEHLRFALNAANGMPDIEVAETIVSAAQKLMQVAARHRDLAANSCLEIEQAFKQLIAAAQNDRRISEAIDPTFIDEFIECTLHATIKRRRDQADS